MVIKKEIILEMKYRIVKWKNLIEELEFKVKIFFYEREREREKERKDKIRRLN